MDVIKILPPLMIGEKEVDYFLRAFDDTLAGCRRFPGPMLELALNTARKAKKARASQIAGMPGPVPEPLPAPAT